MYVPDVETVKYLIGASSSAMILPYGIVEIVIVSAEIINVLNTRHAKMIAYEMK
jgi:hypothetical protein